jgi:hypothetical protein
MVMTTERPTTPIPLEQALAELDSPEAVADRKKRAKQMALKVEGDERNGIIRTARQGDLEQALAPIHVAAAARGFHTSGRPVSMPDAEREAGRNIDALMPRLCEEHLRRTDEAAIYRDPLRLRHQRVWNLYTSQVSQVAWRQGNKSDDWVRRWRQLVADRAAAEEYGDPTGQIDASLKRHVGIDFPRFPEAAWAAVDTIPGEAERQAEMEALEQEYPGTRPASAGTPTTEAPKRRGRRT